MASSVSFDDVLADIENDLNDDELGQAEFLSDDDKQCVVRAYQRKNQDEGKRRRAIVCLRTALQLHGGRVSPYCHLC